MAACCPRFLVLLAACFLAVGRGKDVANKQDKYLKRIGRKFLAEKLQEDGVFKLPSGLLFRAVSEGEEGGQERRSPRPDDSVNVTYAGKLRDGTQFDAGTISFSPSAVIKGWTEALQLMCEGDKWELFIPYDLAYGEQGSPPRIPPFAPLVFELEMHGLTKGKGRLCSDAKIEREATLSGWSLDWLMWWLSSTIAGKILGVLASVALLALALFLEYRYWCHRRKRKDGDKDVPEKNDKQQESKKEE